MEIEKREEVTVIKTIELSKDEIKASECKYNKIWKCQHPQQWGSRCTKPCKYYESMFQHIQKD